MKTDIILRSEGMRVLAQNLGIVDCERFVTIIQREPFDYTKWRQDLFVDETLDEFLDNAMEYRKKTDSRSRKVAAVADW